MKNIKTKRSVYRCLALLLSVVLFVGVMTGCSDQEAQEALDNNGYSYTTSSVTTPNGTSVPTRKYSGELTDEDYDMAVEYQEEYYPNLTVLRDPTIKYNCHSYAWYSTASSNTHWMPYPSAYINDGSYSYVTYTSNINTIPSTVSNGAKVVWLQADADGNYIPIHSGIKYSSTLVTSKWGMMGLYRHAQGYSPYNSDTDALWYYDD